MKRERIRDQTHTHTPIHIERESLADEMSAGEKRHVTHRFHFILLWESHAEPACVGTRVLYACLKLDSHQVFACEPSCLCVYLVSVCFSLFCMRDSVYLCVEYLLSSTSRSSYYHMQLTMLRYISFGYCSYSGSIKKSQHLIFLLFFFRQSFP